MGVPSLCQVTVILSSITVLGNTTPVGTVILEATLPEVAGFVEINLLNILGVNITLTVPCPTVDFTASVDLGGLVTANLSITTSPVVE